MDAKKQQNYELNNRTTKEFSINDYAIGTLCASRVNRRRCKSEGIERSSLDLNLIEKSMHLRKRISHNHDRKAVKTSNRGDYSSAVKITSFPIPVHSYDAPMPNYQNNDMFQNHINSGPTNWNYSPTLPVKKYGMERSPKRVGTPSGSYGSLNHSSPSHGNSNYNTSNHGNSNYNTPNHGSNGTPKYDSQTHGSSPRHPTILEDPNKLEDIFAQVERSVSPLSQPLKTLLKSRRKSPPGILRVNCRSKSPDFRNGEARRRQRAQSDSDYICGYTEYHKQREHYNCNHPLNCISITRQKDCSHIHYQPLSREIKYQMMRPRQNGTTASAHEKQGGLHKKIFDHSECLKTTAIVNDHEMIEVPEETTPDLAPTPAKRQLNGVKSAAPQKKVVKKTTKKAKTKTTKMKLKPSESVLNGVIEDKKPITNAPWQPMDIDLTLEKQKTATINTLTMKMESPIKPVEVIGDIEKAEHAEDDIGKDQNVEEIGQAIDLLSDKLREEVALLRQATEKKEKSKDDSPEGKWRLAKCLETCLRPSLFPRVPPYIRFSNTAENGVIKPPIAIQKHLKWKQTSITPIIVKKTVLNSGFKFMKSECDTSENPSEETLDWVGIWGKHMKSLMFRSLKENQKMNHFPGTFQIGRKDRLWRNLQKLSHKFGKDVFGIMPKTYVLPHDLKLLKRDWDKYLAQDEKWIIKPPAAARGTGIKVVSRWAQIPKKRPVVVQKYVSKPYLINGSKFDMRLYVLVTSINPLRIYLYKEGLARFASVKYTDANTTLHDRFMHLTNYSINRLSKNYTQNEDANACQGHKWTLQALFTYLKNERDVDTTALWESLKDVVIKTIISGENSIMSLTKANVVSRYNCYELFGIDILLDENLKPWLLEVNISPSLHSASPLDIHVKGPLVTAVLNAAQFHVPSVTSSNQKNANLLRGVPFDPRLYTVYLSKDERDKHVQFTSMDKRSEYLDSILTSLTPDDLRHLIQSEDEWCEHSDDLERIFPTPKTHSYLEYFHAPRYYNRLMDAWEQRYHTSRKSGIELLQSFCDIGYHLEVPAVPLKCEEAIANAQAAVEEDGVSKESRVEQEPVCISLAKEWSGFGGEESSGEVRVSSLEPTPVSYAVEQRA